MLRILQLYYEPLPSGQTRHVHSLCSELVRRGHSVTVVLPDYLKTAATIIGQTGAQISPQPLKKLLWGPAAIRNVGRLIHGQDFDIFHIHSQEAGIPGRLMATLAGAKIVVYTPQTIDISRARLQPIYQLSERALSHLTDRIISVNHQDRQRLIRWGIPESKVVTIPNGIELPSNQNHADLAEMRELTSVPPGCPIVMQIGRLTEQKDPLAFVEGAAMVACEIPETHFVMVGEGPLRQKVLDRIRRLNLQSKFHLTGRVENATELIQLADVVTLTSRWEGLPYSLLEAMASARPFVTMDVNGIRDLIAGQPGGIAVPPGDLAGWAKNVVELLHKPLTRDEMGQQGKEQFIERYTLPAMVDRIEHLYFELAQKS